jgi:hypothetical protein
MSANGSGSQHAVRQNAQAWGSVPLPPPAWLAQAMAQAHGQQQQARVQERARAQVRGWLQQGQAMQPRGNVRYRLGRSPYTRSCADGAA